MARARGISIKLEGFDDMLSDIEKAGGSVHGAIDKAMRESAQIVESELKTQITIADPKAAGLASRMPAPEMHWNGDVRCEATVGWKKPETFNSEHPADGHLVALLNYGTPKPRKTKKGYNRGQMVALGFISKAKKSSNRKVKAVQTKTFNEILKGLKK